MTPMTFTAHREGLPHPFWDISSEHGVQPPLTDEAILEAERLLNVTLPVSLLDLLRERNGGLVAADRDAFPTSRPTSWAPDHVPFGLVMGIGDREERTHTLSLLDSPYLVEEWGLPEDVVLLSGDGHYWIGLDYRTGGRHEEPSVTWFDVDDGEELPLARDFLAFTEGLTSALAFADERREGASASA
ncbi:SMI1/KNR4 family protein [Streptomyces sp. NBC_00572]|uniref:SMI1/KNR4 family protein n=1 Tax=Streptomyces sp. NBC_00572 TaxID=2903664 RepID=UPI00225A0EED|nr:SMI1/KNR4 family protein [Streptomyces sp. NBC_00572]MCX4982521.1 SMI1/KNR4 family protein [Streptomyces sp. NBC_00572]